MSKSIRMNPSWAWAGSVLLEVVENGDSQQARDDAKSEVMKALRGYDAMLKKHTDYFDEVEIDNAICRTCDGRGTLEDGDICDAPCEACNGDGMAIDGAEYALTDR